MEAMFCPNVPVDSVKPYIILTFLSSTAVRICFSERILLCPTGKRRQTGRCNVLIWLRKRSWRVLSAIRSGKSQLGAKPAQLEDFGSLNIGNGSCEHDP